MSQPSSFGSLSGSELTAALVDKITQRRALDAEILDLLAVMDAEHVASEVGYSSLAAYVCEATHMSRPTANRLVARAAHFAEHATPTGHVTPAALPHTREAMHGGGLDGEHLDAIVETIKQLPEAAPTGLRELFDQTLADTARTSSPLTVKRHGLEMLQRLNQDGTLPADEKTVTGNELHLQRTRDGGCRFRGRLDQAATEGLLSLLGPLAKPQSPVPGVPDPRSEPERNGDGLAAIVDLVLTEGNAPEHGGEKPHLNLVMSAPDFLTGTGTAIADGGGIFCPAAVLLAACDAPLPHPVRRRAPARPARPRPRPATPAARPRRANQPPRHPRPLRTSGPDPRHRRHHPRRTARPRPRRALLRPPRRPARRPDHRHGPVLDVLTPTTLREVFGVNATAERNPDGVIRISYGAEPLA